MPDAAGAVNRHPAGFIPGLPSGPGFDVIYAFRHVMGGSRSFAFSARTCRIMCDVSLTLTTTTHSPQQHRVVWHPPLQDDPEGPTFIFDTALIYQTSVFYIGDLAIIKDTRWKPQTRVPSSTLVVRVRA